jgi:hypothetical protein
VITLQPTKLPLSCHCDYLFLSYLFLLREALFSRTFTGGIAGKGTLPQDSFPANISSIYIFSGLVTVPLLYLTSDLYSPYYTKAYKCPTNACAKANQRGRKRRKK